MTERIIRKGRSDERLFWDGIIRDGLELEGLNQVAELNGQSLDSEATLQEEIVEFKGYDLDDSGTLDELEYVLWMERVLTKEGRLIYPTSENLASDIDY